MTVNGLAEYVGNCSCDEVWLLAFVGAELTHLAVESTLPVSTARREAATAALWVRPTLRWNRTLGGSLSPTHLAVESGLNVTKDLWASIYAPNARVGIT